MMRIWPGKSRQAKVEDEKKWAEMQQKIEDLRAVVALLESNFVEIEASRTSAAKEK